MTDSDDELRARAEARVGTVLREKYTVDAVIGIGGMASVYAATHRNGRRVALKLLHPELSLRADLRKRFLREAQAANAVKHAGVVAIIDDQMRVVRGNRSSSSGRSTRQLGHNRRRASPAATATSRT